jgi:hypothetical protein
LIGAVIGWSGRLHGRHRNTNPGLDWHDGNTGGGHNARYDGNSRGAGNAIHRGAGLGGNRTGSRLARDCGCRAWRGGRVIGGALRRCAGGVSAQPLAEPFGCSGKRGDQETS